MLENKLNITNEVELAKQEEKITKLKALELYDKEIINTFEVGTFKGLSQIHEYLFSDVYSFAGKMRDVNLAKGNFRFASMLYLNDVLNSINEMPQSTFDEIIDKYIEMNIAHPFMEGNGRATRIWLDLIFIKELKECIDWSKIDKKDYFDAMMLNPNSDVKIKELLKDALTDEIDNRELFLKGIDTSYYYEEVE